MDTLVEIADCASMARSGIYIHIPFCAQRCTYCDFYFVTGQRNMDAFVRLLCREISLVASRHPNVRAHTVYFGGGTPSRLSPDSIARILDALRGAFDLRRTCEVTLEMNPEDAAKPALASLKASGVTRISLGVQSFFDADLRFMNRVHTADCAQSAIRWIQRAGFQSWSLDFIFGMPGSPNWTANLAHAVTTGAPHISAYSLVIEPRTPLAKQVQRGLVRPESNEAVAAHFQETIDTLGAAGYTHYEVSSYAQPGHESLHNQAYWRHVNYLGLGPSAHSFWWSDAEAVRWYNDRSLRRYLTNLEQGLLPPRRREILSRSDLARERIMLGLRTAAGLDNAELKTRYGVDLIGDCADAITELVDQDLLEVSGEVIRLSTKGLHVADGVTTRLWPD